MSEIIYIQRYSGDEHIKYLENQIDPQTSIKWLRVEDHTAFCEHLKLCNQRPISNEDWLDVFESGTIYCGVFTDGKMVSRAAVEKYSADKWEVADVRTANEYRNLGYARQACLFVMKHIFKNRKNATIRTEEDNYKMQRVIKKLGFELMR